MDYCWNVAEVQIFHEIDTMVSACTVFQKSTKFAEYLQKFVAKFSGIQYVQHKVYLHDLHRFTLVGKIADARPPGFPAGPAGQKLRDRQRG